MAAEYTLNNNLVHYNYHDHYQDNFQNIDYEVINYKELNNENDSRNYFDNYMKLLNNIFLFSSNNLDEIDKKCYDKVCNSCCLAGFVAVLSFLLALIIGGPSVYLFILPPFILFGYTLYKSLKSITIYNEIYDLKEMIIELKNIASEENRIINIRLHERPKELFIMIKELCEKNKFNLLNNKLFNITTKIQKLSEKSEKFLKCCPL